MKVFLVPNYYKQEAVESGLMLELWLFCACNAHIS